MAYDWTSSPVAFILIAIMMAAVSHGARSRELGEGKAITRNLLYNGLGHTPQMGWNSYNHFPCKAMNNSISYAADAMVSSGLSAPGYEYINLDDCWAELNRDSQGNLVPKASLFPSGMKALADYIHSKGLKIGIYADAGTLTCSKTMPGSLGHEQQDANTCASWVCSNNCCIFRSYASSFDITYITDELGVQGKKVRKIGVLEVWAGPLGKNRVAVILLNRGYSSATVSARWNDVGLNSSTAGDARDSWAHATRQSVKNQIKATLVSYACKMYVLTQH
ncbi:alpha-galactosidase-like [Herrania umbratica]|uniref:Alpha-galactosidase n=1 Tax=Herrania umbratica TaxID=108875 RepID=A0A6J1BG85_9ROSI|nr:alpha-galactosidase-like [Herrania umbratica]